MLTLCAVENLHIIYSCFSMSTKVHLVKAMIFPVVMYECESWTVKKAEHRRTDAFELWCWGRLLSPRYCKEIQPVHSKEISPGISLEGMMLKLKLQYFGCWEGLGAGGEGNNRG